MSEELYKKSDVKKLREVRELTPLSTIPNHSFPDTIISRTITDRQKSKQLS